MNITSSQDNKKRPKNRQILKSRALATNQITI